MEKQMITAGTIKQEIERLTREFEAAYRRGDFRAVASFYTEDAMVMPPGQETVRGRRAIEQVYQALHDQKGVQDFTIDIDVVDSNGDLAYETGTATYRLQLASGEAPAR